MTSSKRIFVLVFFAAAAALAQPGDYVVDALVTPKTQKTVLTVGGPEADVCGFTNQAIQLAIDALPAEGGTVRLTPGTFHISAPVRAVSHFELIGSGPKTILKISDGVETPFVIDADYGELKVTVEDPSGFRIGMAIQIRDDEWNSCWDVSTARITDIVGNVLYFDRGLIRDYRADLGGMVSNATSGVEAVDVEDVRFADFTVDGNRQKSARMDGCNGAGVFILRSKNVVVENIHVTQFNGEGISWQITENVTGRNCEGDHCANIGLHPGTGSPLTVIENNDVHHNDRDGLYICWRVHHSRVSGNRFHHNERFGICTGHKDTDVLFENNHVFENGSDGIHLRGERASNAPHRNTFVNNVIENNGVKDKEGYGFSINCAAEDVVLKDNIIRDTGKGTQKAAVMIYKSGIPVKMVNNVISGHPEVVREK